jgi:hypothetical protein
MTKFDPHPGWTDELQKKYEEYLVLYGNAAVLLDPSGNITVLPPQDINATIDEILNDNEAD